MAIVYASNTLTWDGSKWILNMSVSASQEGVNPNPFVVESFISPEDLLDDDGSALSSEALELKLRNDHPYLYRRVASPEDLLSMPSVDALSTDLLDAYAGRLEQSETVTGSSISENGQTFTVDDYSKPRSETASTHYDHVALSGYYKYRVRTIQHGYSTYDLASAIRTANDSFLRSYAGEYLDDPSSTHLPLSVGVANVYPKRTFSAGSLSALGLVAGDSLYLSVSGGSGDYSVSSSDSSLLARVGTSFKFVVMQNVTSAASITITDTKTSESIQVSVTTVEKD